MRLPHAGSSTDSKANWAGTACSMSARPKCNARFEEASALLDGVVAREPGLDLGIGLSLARVLGRQDIPAAIKILDDYRARTGHSV
jgi:hypothetical protein